jgi:hypothetical protein
MRKAHYKKGGNTVNHNFVVLTKIFGVLQTMFSIHGAFAVLAIDVLELNYVRL